MLMRKSVVFKHFTKSDLLRLNPRDSWEMHEKDLEAIFKACDAF